MSRSAGSSLPLRGEPVVGRSRALRAAAVRAARASNRLGHRERDEQASFDEVVYVLTARTRYPAVYASEVLSAAVSWLMLIVAVPCLGYVAGHSESRLLLLGAAAAAFGVGIVAHVRVLLLLRGIVSRMGRRVAFLSRAANAATVKRCGQVTGRAVSGARVGTVLTSMCGTLLGVFLAGSSSTGVFAVAAAVALVTSMLLVGLRPLGVRALRASAA